MIAIYDDKARKELLKGARKLYKAVATTFGPKGRNVVIHRLNQEPVLTHDGVTVAEAFRQTENSPMNTGVELIKAAARKMGNNVGDGTTTVTVLTYYILKEADRLIASGYNPMQLRKELNLALWQIVKYIEEHTEVVKSNFKEVATISAGDEQLGCLIADVIKKVGEDGLVTVEKSSGFDVSIEISTGFKVNYGFASPLLATDPVKGICEYSNPRVLIVKGKVASIAEVLPILQAVAASGMKELLIVAESTEGEALHNIIINKLQDNLRCVAVNIPAYQKDILEDVARTTKAQVIAPESGIKLSEANLQHLGEADKIIVDRDSLSIIGGKGDIKEKVKELKNTIKDSPHSHSVEEARKRLARLTGSVGIIKVGGGSDTEIEEKKFRIDDAVAATQAALRSGIVPGGGVIFLNASKALSDAPADNLLKRALEQPARHILNNAGLPADEFLPKIKEAPEGYGFNIAHEPKLNDMKEQGVIDPAEVSTEAIKTAVSIASSVLTTGAVLVEEKPNDPKTNSI